MNIRYARCMTVSSEENILPLRSGGISSWTIVFDDIIMGEIDAPKKNVITAAEENFACAFRIKTKQSKNTPPRIRLINMALALESICPNFPYMIEPKKR